jgi:hypothetical protein
MYNKGFLPKGRFQTITPCFRDERFDSWHTKYFIKNELINTDNTGIDGLSMMILYARLFLEEIFGAGKIDIIEIKKDLEYDLCFRGIELGSYGIRKCEFLSWIYGTGIAEPRTSRAKLFFEGK